MKRTFQRRSNLRRSTVIGGLTAVLAFASFVGELHAQQTVRIETASLPDGTLGVPYSQALVASRGTLPYVWSIASGSLPAGLTLSPGVGLISGVPTSVGKANFSVRVTDSSNPPRTDTQGLSITIDSTPLSITTVSLPAGLVGVPYVQNLVAAGGTPPYTWSRQSGTLPVGLSLSSDGTISGTPTTTGTSNFTVRVTDRSDPAQTASKALSVVISLVPAPLTITTSSLPSGSVGSAYSQTLAAAGGTPPYAWSIAVGSLPAGLALSAQGQISGVPTTAGTTSFTVRVTDSSNPAQTASKALTIVIDPAPTPLTITTESLPSGTVGSAYSQTLGAAGGTPPYTWSTTAGSLPAGLTLSVQGLISGNPTAAGTATFTVRVTDSRNPAQTASKALSLIISSAPIPPTITTTSLPSGTVGSGYSQTLAATGGTPPYNWSTTAGSLPGGLILSAQGEISGIPTTAGTASFTVRITDSRNPAQTASQVLTITIDPAPVPPTITTVSLPSGTVGSAYSQSLAAAGGTPPYSWSTITGSLPAGLTLSVQGLISGNPTAAGTATFTVRVTDSRSPAQTASKVLSITIDPAPVSLTITTTSLPAGTVGTAYLQSLAAAGGTTPYSWSVLSGTLPAGLSLSSTGTLAGTPTGSGNFTFEIRVADAALQQQATTRTFTIGIANPGPSTIPALSLTGVPNAVNPTQQTEIAVGLSAPHPVALAGTLTISFDPTAAIPVDDPMVRFSTGTRTVNFTIPANTTRAVFSSPVLLLAGTVSGMANLTANIQGGPAGVLVGSVLVRSLAPQIMNISAVRRSGTLEVRATGYSPDRRVTRIEFDFDVRTADGVVRANLSKDALTEFDNWFRNPSSAAFGSAFLLTQIFLVDGDTSTVQSVIVTFTNEQGRTSSLPVQITN